MHRFSKTQQVGLLGAVEDRIVLLVAATTENPSFSVVSPLLSRSLVLQLQSLTEDEVRELPRRAVTDQRGLNGSVSMSAKAEDALVRLAAGDARRALTALEASAAGLAAVRRPIAGIPCSSRSTPPRRAVVPAWRAGTTSPRVVRSTTPSEATS